MIEIIEGLPDNIMGIIVKGRVTKKDCSDVLLPALEKSLVWHHKLRLYYEIRSRYPGAAWEEINLGIRHTVQALRLLIPSEIRVFASSQIPEGLAWVTGAPVRKRRLVPARVTSSQSRSFRPPPQYLDRVL